MIVKFSGNGERPEDQRWADLLIAEHIAAEVLAKHGIPAASTQILYSGNRVFLESTRFDRVGTYGRRNIASLLAFDSAFFGEPHTPWTAAAQRLESSGWFSKEDANHLQILWWFGTLIGNTDMHYGNVNMFSDAQYPLQLAQSYDILPMHYRPDVQGNLPERSITPIPPSPEALGHWRVASSIAFAFWERLANENTVSAAFGKLSAQSYEAMKRLRRQFKVDA